MHVHLAAERAHLVGARALKQVGHEPSLRRLSGGPGGGLRDYRNAGPPPFDG
jgi:hypothetical protein